MTTAGDIKDIIIAAGAAFTIIREAGNVSGEYATYTLTNQATKPITLEHFRQGYMPHDTNAAAGEVVEFDDTNERYLLTNKLPSILWNDVVRYSAVFYKCNVNSGELLRPSGEVRDDQYHMKTQWEPIKNNCDAMQVASLYGNDLEEDKALGLLGLKKDEVYIPHSVGAQVMDRWQPASGEYYQVSVISTRRFPGVDVLIVEEDNR